MATNLTPVTPPLGQKVLDESGIFTPPWANYFNNIYRYQWLNEDGVKITVGTVEPSSPNINDLWVDTT